jgi:hypothetical protein
VRSTDERVATLETELVTLFLRVDVLEERGMDARVLKLAGYPAEHSARGPFGPLACSSVDLST